MIKKVITYILFFTLFSPFLSALQADKIIGQIIIHNGDNVPVQTILDVLPIKEGKPYNIERLDLAITNLRKWNVFENIQVRTSTRGNLTDIHFFLDEAIIVGRVDIYGNYPFIENKIRKRIKIRAGDIYLPSRAQKQIDRIVSFYQREGYFGTKVLLEEEYNTLDNTVSLILKIQKGYQLRYGNIDIKGNKRYPKGRFTSKINPLRPYHPRRLKNSINELRDLYNKKGFLWSKVAITKQNIDLNNKKIDLELKIYEGPRAKFKFSGNKGVSNRTLKKSLTFFKEGSLDEYEIEASKEKIKEAYINYGYPGVQIDTKKIFMDNKDIKFKFIIDEEKRIRIKKIHFNGNRKIKSKKLKKHIITHENTLFDKGVYDEEVLSEDIQALKSFYNSIGYPNSQIGQPLITKNKIEDKIYIDIPIDEGTPVVINEISIINQDLFDSKEILKKTKLKSADVLNLEIAKQDRNSVLLFFSSNGYPYAEVKQDFKYIQDNQVDVIYTVKPGKHVKVGKILIVGNLLTTITTIKKALSLKENDPFAYEEVIKSQLTLRRLGIFNSVEVETIGLDTKEGIVHLLIKVEERRPFQVDIEAGYSTDENFASTLRFTNLNSFGWAKRTGLELTGGKNIAKSELSWIDPHLLGHDIEMVLASWLQYEDKQIYNYSQIGGKVAFLRHLHRTSFLVAQEIDRNYFLTGSSTAADEDSLRDNTLLKTTFSASFDTRNSFAYPTKGIFTQASTDFFNELYGNNARFVKLGSKGEAFYTLFNFFTIVNSARVDRIQNLIDGSSVPSNELLYLGGDNTLRGFGRDSLGPIDANGDPTGGRTRWIYNAELRLPIWNSLKWGFFYDMGSLTEHFGDINLDNVRHSTGFGIRYVTPVGPIRADYGIKLDRKSDEDFGRFHLTFGWAF